MRQNPKFPILLIQALLIFSAISSLFTCAGAEEGRAGARGVVLIHDVYELQNMSLDLNGSYELANDIEANRWDRLGFEPVGNDTDSYYNFSLQHDSYPFSFNGTFNGNGHTILSLSIYNMTAGRPIGLFGCTGPSARISNVTIASFQVQGAGSTGALVGFNSGTISDCVCGPVTTLCILQGSPSGGLVGTNDGRISRCSLTGQLGGELPFDPPWTGGVIAGMNLRSGMIDNCTVQATIKTGDEAGGVAANSTGTIADCSFSGSLNGGRNIGGIVSEAAGLVIDCSCAGTVSGTLFVGGIAGMAGNIINCFNQANVSGTGDHVGGIAGYNGKGKVSGCFNTGTVTGNSFVGGLVGLNNGNITRCYNTGAVCGTDEVGGLAGENSNERGYMGNITDCYNTGAVHGNDQVGGLAGYHLYMSDYNGKAVLLRCYNAGPVLGENRTGALAGLSVSGIIDCYFDNETSGWSDSPNGTARNTSDMVKQATFAGWDFNTVWKIEEDVSYPYLREMPMVTVNHPPVITRIFPTNVTAGKVFIFSFGGYDPDGDLIRWNVTSNVSWLGYNEQMGVFGGNPSLSDVGTYLVTVTASDGRGGSTSATFELTVSESIQGLEWLQVPQDANLIEGDDYSATVRATDGDGGTILYNLRPYPVTEGLFDDFNDDSIDPAKWTAQAEDGIVVGEQGGALVFNGTKGSGELWYPLANVTSVATTTAIHADLVSFSGTGSGYASGIVLYQDEKNHVVLGPIVDPGQYGSGRVNIQLGYRTNDVWHNIGLGELGPGPHRFGIVYQAGHATFYDNDNVLYNLSIQLQDVKYHVFGNARGTGDTLLAAWDNVSSTDAILLPPGMAIDSLNGSIRWTNATAGYFSFLVSAGSVSGSVEHIFNLTVSKKAAPPPINRAPQIAAVTAPENRTVRSSETLAFSADATDPDGDNLTYEWKENNVTLSTEKSFSRKFAPGNHSLVLLIGDGHYVTTRTFNFTVAQPPKTIEAKPVSVPGFEAGVASAAVTVAVVAGLFWRRERR